MFVKHHKKWRKNWWDTNGLSHSFLLQQLYAHFLVAVGKKTVKKKMLSKPRIFVVTN